jgi:amino acid transporter
MTADAPAKRPLTLFDVTCVGVNAIVGSSIFLFPGKLAGMLGPASVLAFGVTGLLLFTVALCFAEAGARFDGHGGPYIYARAAFGPTVGFAIGWVCWVAELLSWAAVANGVASYLSFFGPAFERAVVVKGIAAAVILVMGAINYRGVKAGAWTSNALTIAKLLPLGLLVVVGLPKVSAANLTPFAPHGFRPLGAACFLTYFAYSGFECVPVPAGECDRAQRNVPLAVLASLGVSAAVYMLVQFVAVGVEPNLAGSARPLADAAVRVMGPGGALLIVGGSLLSTIGYNAGCALGGPRYLVALGEQGDMPAAAARRHPVFGTPALAVAWTTGLTLVMALALDFNKLVDVANVVICAQYLATCAAVVVLRRRGPSPGFSIPGGPLIPLAGVVSTLWLGAQGGLSELAF